MSAILKNLEELENKGLPQPPKFELHIVPELENEDVQIVPPPPPPMPHHRRRADLFASLRPKLKRLVDEFRNKFPQSRVSVSKPIRIFLLVACVALAALPLKKLYVRNRIKKEKASVLANPAQEQSQTQPSAGNPEVMSLNPEEEYRRAHELMNKNDQDSAIQVLDQLNSTYKNKLGIVLSKAEALEKKGDWTSAEKLFLEATKIEPENAYTLNNFGMMYVRKGEIQRGIDLLTRALGRSPERAEPILNLAHAFEQRRDWKLAAETYKSYLKHPNANSQLADPIQKHLAALEPMIQNADPSRDALKPPVDFDEDEDFDDQDTGKVSGKKAKNKDDGDDTQEDYEP